MEVCIAQVALGAATYAIDRPYSYLLPEELVERTKPGMRVLVPFGRGNKRTDGVVLQVVTTEESGGKLKSVLTVLDDEPMLDRDGLQLAMWLRERCFCTVYEAARAMLPAGLWFSIKDSWKIVSGVEKEKAYEAAGRSKRARQILDMLFANEGCGEMERIRAALGVKDPMPALKMLHERGILEKETNTRRGVSDKKEQIAVLTMPAEEAMTQIQGKRRTAPLQYAVMELLCSMGRVSVKELCYFTGASRGSIKALEKRGYLRLEQCGVLRQAICVDSVLPAGPVTLNEEQQAAFEGLKALLDAGKPGAALLYGVTGSGKTQVYLKLIRHVLDQGRTALVLVPEISLTPQVMRLFLSHFGCQVAVLHSSLSAGARCDEWKRAKSGAARVVVGTRSAVFAPLPDLGLVILDEEQDGAYKSEQAPRYHARDAAKYRCARAGGLLLLGSATPSVETMYHAQQGEYRLFTLRQRFNTQALPGVELVDLKEELGKGNGGSISGPLRAAISENLSRGEQSILFINRRGASRMVTCGECGYVPECPNCSIHMTYHSANHRLMCHYCGHSEPLPEDCPECGGRFAPVGVGTQKVQEELEQLFPGVEVLRMDADTISATQTHDVLLGRFQRKRIPILVGTQMVAKGLDFENVTLVGVIAADSSLYMDDYRAGERTFSVLTQVVGRAGRGEKTGRAIIQTWTPKNDVILCASTQDYDHFYEEEIQLRQARNFPPFCHLYQITVTGTEEEQTVQCCLRLKGFFRNQLNELAYRDLECRILGPAPAPVTKVNNRYRYRLLLSGPDHKKVRALVAHVVRCAQKDRLNSGLIIFADLDPQD